MAELKRSAEEMMKAIRFLFIAALLFALAGTSHSGEPSPSGTSDEVLRLKPLRVTAGYFDITYPTDVTAKGMSPVKVTWVAPHVKRMGVNIGYYLTGIDGVPVSEMTLADFLRSLELPLETGASRIFIFTKPRGLFRKSNDVAISITKTGDKEPIQPPQRNAGSGPSSDDSPASETSSSLGPRG